MSSGSRNLIILGCAVCLIALTTTSIELLVYHNSGDIYLDRSRPGFLPDEEEVESSSQNKSAYSYSETGSLDAGELKEYLDELEKIEKHVNLLDQPYDATPLTDESLGIAPVSESQK